LRIKELEVVVEASLVGLVEVLDAIILLLIESILVVIAFLGVGYL